MHHIERFTIEERPDLAELAFSVRREVFVGEQKVDPGLEYENEDRAVHYLLILDGEPVSAARWRGTDRGIKLERFATLQEYRDRGLGSKILKRVMDDILPMGKPIYLHSQLRAIPFYERFGFVKKGEMFEEAGIWHYEMWYEKS